MKFVVPLNDIDYYEQLVEAGASEFFCGYVPYKWLDNYSVVLPLNRREWLLGGVNIHSIETIKVLRRKIERYGINVSITLNARYYIPEQYPIIIEIMQELIDQGINSFIITDIALLLHVRELGLNCNIQLSGVASVRNRNALILLNELEINRYIFARKIPVEDMKKIISINPKIEYEAFFLNERCLLSEEYCNSLLCERVHTMCTLGYNVDWIETPYFSDIKHMLTLQKRLFRKNNGVRENILKGNTDLGVRGCGLCMYKNLKMAGVNYLKIVGRMLDPNSIIHDLNAVKKIADFDNTIHDADEFKQCIKKHFFDDKCPVSCYYLLS